jgi:hypothetical protein
MPTPPLISIRLTGDPIIVRLATDTIPKLFSPRCAIRISRHQARRTGHVRAYITVTRKEAS